MNYRRFRHQSRQIETNSAPETRETSSDPCIHNQAKLLAQQVREAREATRRIAQRKKGATPRIEKNNSSEADAASCEQPEPASGVITPQLSPGQPHSQDSCSVSH